MVEPAVPSIAHWEQLDTLKEPHYVKVTLTTGERIIIKQEGTWIKTWRYE